MSSRDYDNLMYLVRAYEKYGDWESGKADILIHIEDIEMILLAARSTDREDVKNSLVELAYDMDERTAWLNNTTLDKSNGYVTLTRDDLITLRNAAKTFD